MKTPGDGGTYAVGTTWVNLNGVGPTTFFGSFIAGPQGLPRAQDVHVAVVRVTDAQGGLVNQWYFHGDDRHLLPPNDSQTSLPHKTFARGIAVRPGPTNAETRIVICGDTFDEVLPKTPPMPPPPTPATGGQSAYCPPHPVIDPAGGNLGPPNGFLAVYDGDGLLLWSYHFYGRDTLAPTAITDVAIHVEGEGASARDVVTYCGCSANGNYDDTAHPANSTMIPLRPFAAPSGATPAGCPDIYTAGDIHNAAAAAHTDEWDGIVGRLSASHANPTPASVLREFHSIVGGRERDGLFGITLKDENRFAVVGVTMPRPSGVIGGNAAFPLTFPGNQVCSGNGSMLGVFLEFDAAPTRIGLNLDLVGSCTVGAPGVNALGEIGTQARDVLYHDNLYYIVGSTTDPNLATVGAFHPQLNGSAGSPLPTGFIASAGSPNHPFVFASYFLAPGLHESSGLTSVSAWNEYPDHLAVAGWTEGNDGSRDIVVATLFRDSTPGGSGGLQIVRQHRITANGDEAPAARNRGTAFFGIPTLASALSPTASQHAFVYTRDQWDAFRDFSGGGLAVDPRGRLTVVGATQGTSLTFQGYVSDFPAVGAGSAGAQASHDLTETDAVFAVVEMLPDGVCRSDGTGSCPPPGWSPVGNGGTTPACALSPFGMLPAASPPILKRMFLDYEGTPGSGYVSLVVDRPPPSSWVAMSAWHIGGVPAPTPFFDAAHEVELWFATPASLAFYPVLTLGGSARETWSALPLGFTYMAQYVCLLAQPLSGTPCTGTTLDWAATPAMVFSH